MNPSASNASTIACGISLFQRIVRDLDFQAGKLDTGYLDRLFASKEPEQTQQNDDLVAIAAGLFAAIDATSTERGHLSPEVDANGKSARAGSNWKKASRLEALR